MISTVFQVLHDYFGLRGGVGRGSVGQGGSSPGMNAEQLDDAAAKLEEVFTPAVKRLRVKQSTEVLLDSLFNGEDDAGPFVVRFEVTLTRWAERRGVTLCGVFDRRFSAVRNPVQNSESSPCRLFSDSVCVENGFTGVILGV